ncbi:MAG: 2-oxoacid:ferredoxin oxidoreductase subunit beta [Rhodospirillaceae bacterium]|jgi:2-oxoglutarate/2-oxoacid ferredoxin oxidoreductase subunit beta|nr:2-oxoacid:ferredoxin oxidoreductase subunit beta [Rhodospirillaceae bacterium]MBT5567019.1 2-oxoacid:ferredoxin oxidoreductase subunit beta [Rhodospirillaceae bacterium]MBT6090478.1 2-oxoacid:ferredoxin oxidoreductase subunit beta [Rhodospirillaceae bacterium]MBT7451759.1 2-oxoacid:ferredoxin oxidoreductase subunit beta [Rhodospirillaceae bacterium]
MNIQVEPAKLKAKDFASDQEVRWCPGCGDYAILKAVQVALANMGAEPDNTVFVSGIGCAARFPYYMATYGFHTIHGRAPAVASGVKLANPDLDVWIVSGDGDALSIGGNHLLHVLRRNMDVQFLLFNNEIYGLTKGQYSPTSRVGQKSPSTPQGSIDSPVDACTFALGCNARFVARGIDIQAKDLGHLFTRARDHKGASFVEIIQNCIVFNDDAFAHFTAKNVAKETQIHVAHGEKLIYGAESNKGLRVKPGSFELEAVTIGEDGVTEDDILVHDETNRVLASLLVAMKPPSMPVALGVIYCDPAPSYEQAVKDQVEAAKAKGLGDMDTLLRSGSTWTVS